MTQKCQVLKGFGADITWHLNNPTPKLWCQTEMEPPIDAKMNEPIGNCLIECWELILQYVKICSLLQQLYRLSKNKKKDVMLYCRVAHLPEKLKQLTFFLVKRRLNHLVCRLNHVGSRIRRGQLRVRELAYSSRKPIHRREDGEVSNA